MTLNNLISLSLGFLICNMMIITTLIHRVVVKIKVDSTSGT